MTHGSPLREARPIAGSLMAFDLAREIALLREEPQYRDGRRNAKTLVKEGELRVMLVVLRSGVTFDGDDPRGRLSMLVESGRIAVRADDGAAVDLGPNEIAVIDSGRRWSAQATEETALVIHTAWPIDPGNRAP